MTRFHFDRPDGPPGNNAQNILIHLNEFVPPQGYGAGGGVPLNVMEFEPNWIDLAFQKRIPLTINTGQVPSTQNDFPLLFNDTYSDLIGEVEGELRFAGNDAVELPYEIQKFDSITGKLIAWAKKPKVSDGDFIGIYFDNPAASDAQNPAAVWSDYGAVYHMNQSSFGVDSILDSTVNDNKGSTSGSPTSVPGQIGDAYRTNSGGIVTIPTSPSVDIGGGSFTVEAWIETFGAGFTFFGVIEKKIDFNGSHIGWQLHNDFRQEASGLQFRLNNGTTINDEVMTNGGPARSILRNNGLHHVAFTFDSATTDSAAYIDGVPGDIDPYLKVPVDFTNTEPVVFGRTTNPDMILDEVRLSSVLKTADYMTTSFNNQSNPSTFYTTGAVESAPALLFGVMEFETLGVMEFEQ